MSDNIIIRKPSQIVNTGSFLIGAFLVASAIMVKPYLDEFTLQIPLGLDAAMSYYWITYALIGSWLFYRVLVVKAISYRISEERVTYRHGLLIAVRDEVELFRVKDVQLVKPLFYRIFGLSNLYLHTSDSTHPTLPLGAISNGEITLNSVRSRVEIMRSKKGVREFD